MPRWLRFNVLLWILTIVAVAWFIGEPPLMDFWAASQWKQIGCHLEKDRYFYELDHKTYNVSRENFWQFGRVHDIRDHPMTFEINGTCWVNPRNADQAAVRFLNAHSDLSHAGGRIAGAVLVFIAVFLFTQVEKRRNLRRAIPTPP